jgi:hypothetical protein
MGWLRSSSPTSSDNEAGHTSSTTNADWALSHEQRQRIFGKPRPEQSPHESRDSKADKELEALINSLSFPDPKSREAASKRSENPSPEQQSEDEATHSRILPDGSLNISREALYPRTMSCRHAFDQAYYCQSLGGKFKDIYRFGALQSCSEQWGAFWFCMRTKSFSPEERERQIRDHYAGREERRKKEFGSSEDVWEMRTKAVERAFQRDPDAEEGGSEHLIKE